MKIIMIRRNHYIVIGPDGGIYLVDAGYAGTAKHIIIPFMNRYFPGRKIRGIVVTHSHMNHTGGVPPLQDKYRDGIQAIYSSGIVGSGQGGSYALDPITWDEMNTRCAKYGIPHVHLGAGDTISDPHMDIQILGPLPQYQGDNPTDDPDGPTTLVVRFSTDDGSALCCGDLGDSGRYQLMEVLTAQDSQSDVFAIPHHGDPRCVNDEILAEVDPKYCIAELNKGDEAIAFVNSRGIPGHALINGPIEVTLNNGNVSTNLDLVDRFKIGRMPIMKMY